MRLRFQLLPTILAVSIPILATLALPAQTALAENEGLDDLDKATEAKLSARALDELTAVIRLLDSALEKGLDKDNTEFAEQLLVASLLERATTLSNLILDRPDPHPRWQELRHVAVRDLNRAIAIDETQMQAHLLLGRLLILPGGDRDAARESLDKVIASEATPAKTRAKAYIHRASAQSDDAAAIADYDKAVELVPEDAQTRRARAMFHLRRDRHGAALADLDKSLELEPDHAATHEARGLALLMKGRFEDALAAFDRAAELAPESATPHQNRARALALQNKLDEAIAALDRAIEVNPAAIPAFLLRAQILASKGDAEKAMEAVEDVLALRPGFVQAVRMKAEILAGTGRVSEAIAVLEEARTQHPNDIQLLMQIGTYHVFDENSRGAIEVLSDVLRQNATNIRALRSRADAYLNIGKHAEAIADYSKAVELAPENTGVLNNFAWVLATSPNDDLRDGKRAVELALKGCELTEYKAAHILSTLAAAYAESGDWENAVKWATEAVETSRGRKDDEGNPRDPEELAQLEKELASYLEKKPWREMQVEEERTAPDENDAPPDDDDAAPARTIDF